MLRNVPIRRKLMTANLLTSGAVLLLTCLAFFAYEVLTFRQSTVEKLSTLGKIIAANSTAALAFDDSDAATEILAALKAESHIVAAGLYGTTGKLFAQYPVNSPAAFPSAPGQDGYRFERGRLAGFLPVMQDNRRLGTLYINSDMGAIYEQLWRRGEIAALVMALSLLVAYLLSRSLQRQISVPILALAETANSVSKQRDFSVRAKKFGGDELGLLTDAFNQMLAEIQKLNATLELRVQERTAQLETANVELSRSRAVLESLFKSLPGLFLVLTPDLKIVTASDAYLKATMTKRENLVGRDLFDAFPDNPDDSQTKGSFNVRASLNRVLQTAEADTMAIQKYDVRRPDGVFEERFWSPINSPVLGADRRIEYIIHRVEDVTDFVKQQSQKNSGGDEDGLRVKMERMEAEIFRSSQEVQAANEKLQTANKELEAFSYSVSHDLRAPLRHVDGFVDLLRKQSAEKLDERGRRYLDIIADSARRMGALIDDLLVFSRMSRTDLRYSKVASESLVHEVRDALQGEIRGRVVWKMDSLPQIEADTAMLRQVWANLIGNAIKYSRTRDPAEIEIGCTDSGNGEFVFFVRDNGVGFDMQYVDKLFGVFQRLHRADEFEGTGIGLANVRRIISRHGGRTWAEGKVDGGATFFFSLPKNPTETKG